MNRNELSALDRAICGDIYAGDQDLDVVLSAPSTLIVKLIHMQTREPINDAEIIFWESLVS